MLICQILDCGPMTAFKGIWVTQAFISVFLAILFIQSALDKVFDFSGNLGWLKEHFGKSFLKNVVPLLLATLTIIELSAGLVSAFGVIQIIFSKSFCLAFIGVLLSAVALVMLFFGQRIAKDYAGAASLVPYFIVVIISLYFLA